MIKDKTTADERLAEFKKNNATFFFKPYPWQRVALEKIRYKNTTAIICSNKIGKTALLENLLISWLAGYEPWEYVDKDDPDAVEIQGHYYRRSSLGIEPPVDIILTGEDWKLHIGRVLVPELKKWAPKGWYRTKKNEQGVEYLWEFCDKNGSWKHPSTLTLMSYSQDDALFESFRAQGVGMDEPPPKSKYKAMSRGLLLDRGKTVLSLTPIKEAWILDDIVLSDRKDIGIIDGLMITDNPDLLNNDIRTLTPYLSTEEIASYFDLLLYEDKAKGKPVTDRGYAATSYLEKIIPEKAWDTIGDLRILKFIRDIDPSDVPPRIFGQFKSLVGRVLKEFDVDMHKIKPFLCPTDWPVTVMIDFHLSTPQAISYWAVNPQDCHYCIDETWEHLSADGIADDIIRKWKSGYNIHKVFIDPLSKGDTAYMRNQLGTNIRDTYSILDEKLSKYKMTLAIASKDKESGIKNIKDQLKGPNQMPTVFIFDTCERHFFEVQRWVFDDEGKPIKENDHFMENWYRYTLTGAKYSAFKIKPLPPRSGSPATHGSWMGN
jgi:hypothetical protein